MSRFYFKYAEAVPIPFDFVFNFRFVVRAILFCKGFYCIVHFFFIFNRFGIAEDYNAFVQRGEFALQYIVFVNNAERNLAVVLNSVELVAGFGAMNIYEAV